MSSKAVLSLVPVLGDSEGAGKKVRIKKWDKLLISHRYDLLPFVHQMDELQFDLMSSKAVLPLVPVLGDSEGAGKKVRIKKWDKLLISHRYDLLPFVHQIDEL